MKNAENIFAAITNPAVNSKGALKSVCKTLGLRWTGPILDEFDPRRYSEDHWYTHTDVGYLAICPMYIGRGKCNFLSRGERDYMILSHKTWGGFIVRLHHPVFGWIERKVQFRKEHSFKESLYKFHAPGERELVDLHKIQTIKINGKRIKVDFGITR